MSYLKLAIAWPLSWFCYWVGDLYSWVMERWDNETWVAFWYPLYNDFMIDSSYIQDWAGGTKYFPWDQVSSSGSTTED